MLRRVVRFDGFTFELGIPSFFYYYYTYATLHKSSHKKFKENGLSRVFRSMLTLGPVVTILYT